MHRFYFESQIKDDVLTLHDSDQIKQMKKVLRLSEGDRIILFDNSGYDFDCEIVTMEVKAMKLRVLHKTKGIGFKKECTLYMALLKKDNFELVLQKAVELGASKVVPVVTERCVKNTISDNQYERYRSIVKEATEQSEGSMLPELGELRTYAQALDEVPLDTLNLIFNAREDALHIQDIDLDRKVTLFIGPEGGFTPQELEEAQGKGLISVSLGRRILRAETAAIATLAKVLI
jgi:16S rRNA (uracil1498-N3)-methyltransferase